MKRAVWLLLAVFCAALWQVQPVDGVGAKARCHCCHPSACGMPGCCASATTACSPARAEDGARLSAPTRMQAARSRTETFYASFVETDSKSGPSFASARAVPAARVPLFEAHCSLLI